MSFKEFDAPIEWAFKKKNSIFTPVNKKKTLVNSQNLNKNYYESASFVVYAAKHTLKKINFPKYYGLILPKYRAVDIDTNEDWKLAEMFFKKKTNNE